LLKTAHFIVAFKNPEQVHRLVKSLLSENSTVFIHIDKKIDIRPFLYIAQLPNVYFIRNRQYIVWGGYSITECIISGMKEILDSGHFDYLILMSGQDYPIRPMDEFNKLLMENNGYSIMSSEPKVAKSRWWHYAVDRYNYYYLNDYQFKGKKLIQKIAKKIFPKRKFLYQDYQLYGGPGATFCALTNEAAAYIVKFMEGNKKAYRFARFTHASDEFWFQTLLMNSPLKDKVINSPLWYIDWGGISKHPRILTMLDFPSLMNSGMYFARKFDIYVDEMVLDMLDNHLNERKNLRTLRNE